MARDGVNNVRLSEHFNLWEFEDKLTRTVRLDGRLWQLVSYIRDRANRPLVITSAFRSKATHERIYRERYGAAWKSKITRNSYHLTGEACDFRLVSDRWAPEERYEWLSAEMDGFLMGGGGMYRINGGCFHVDVRRLRWRGEGGKP